MKNLLMKKNTQNCYVAKKRIVSKLSKISLSNFSNTNWRLEIRLFHNFTSLSLILSEKLAVKVRYGRAGSLF